MKVVINRCYGGFGVSPLALVELIKLGSAVVSVSDAKDYYGGGLAHLSRDWEQAYAKALSETTPLVDGYLVERFLGTLHKDGKIYNYERDDKFRNDPALVQVVERLGAEADGPHAKLAVVEVPDDVTWYIDEYDGIETVNEQHRSWS